MDENLQQPAGGSQAMKFVVPAVVIGLIVIAVVAFYVMGQNTNSTAGNPSPTPQAQLPTAAPTESDTEGAMAAQYKDGTYSATGQYVSPGGPRDVDVSITLTDGVISAATFTGHATDPNSKRFQGEFRDNFKTQVVGKNIDDVSVMKVAGSSLSPKGFMDALTQIKEEAQA